jgi:pimeloyl-ACP methyl ester carboxylesterase
LDRLAGVLAPALVIVGEDDICTPPRYADELVAALPNTRLVRIPDAGHCAVFEQPDAVARAIREFLDTQR